MGCTCGGNSAPSPVVVNPGATAGQQATYNRDAALEQRALNMVDQHTPEGSVTYAPTGTERVEGIPDYSVTQTMSPVQRALYDEGNEFKRAYGEIGNAQLEAVRGSLEQPFSLSDMGVAPTINEGTRTAARDAMIARLAPQMDKQRDALNTRLANQGFVAGTEAYDTAFDEMNRRENDLYLGADAAAGNEMARMYGLESSVRDKAINELLMQRQQPMSELATFASGSQPQRPSFVGTPQGQIAAPDFTSAAYGSANQANQGLQWQQDARNQQLAGLYGLGGAGLMAGGMSYGDGGWRFGW